MSHDISKDPAHAMMMVAIREERKRQLQKWGVQRHPHGTGSEAAGLFASQWKVLCDAKHDDDIDDWFTIAGEEMMEVGAETDLHKLFEEVTQAAAVFTAWGEAIIEEIQKKGGSL